MTGYWAEFGAIAIAHALAVVSPGPDLALILRQSLREGRGPAIWTSAGIGSGILVHSAYTVAGLGLLLTTSPAAFAGMRLAGAAYLGWLGWQSLRHAGCTTVTVSADADRPVERSRGSAWLKGFLTNVLNPKAALFFIALFPALVSPTTPRWMQSGYGVWMASVTTAWFALVASVLTRPAMQKRYRSLAPWVDRVLGGVFLAFAASVALAPVP